MASEIARPIPIETLWGVLKRMVKKRRPQTQSELKKVVSEEWQRLSETQVIHVFESIYHRIDCLYENSGEHIDY